MMNVADIRAYARHQRLRGVEVVEIQQHDWRVTIRIDSVRGHEPDDETGVAHLNGTSSQPACLRSEALGILRLAHPVQLPQAVAKGDRVARGQLLALLEVGESLTPVHAPADGVVEEILATEGQRIDYGKPLLRIASVAGAK